MIKKLCFIVFSFSLLCLMPERGFSQTLDEEQKNDLVEWELHQSVTGTYDVKFPQKYKYNIFPFQFRQDKIAFSSQILSSLDGNSASKDRSILVKSVQTFGAELTYKQVKSILEREARQYEQAVSSFGGQVLGNEDIEQKGYNGKNIYVSYESNGAKYGIRIRLYVTNYAKIEQVLTGPAQTMYSFRADDFFDSLSPHDGLTNYEKEGDLGKGWLDFPSKNNIFTVKFPPKNLDYTPIEPKFTATPNRGIANFFIMDPVLKEPVLYNVYSYKLGKVADYQNVKSLLFSGHVANFVPNATIASLDTENTLEGGINVMRAKLVITPIPEYPHVNVIVYEARYIGDIVIIKEFLSNSSHSLSGLDKTLFSLTSFHPDRYKPTSENAEPKTTE